MWIRRLPSLCFTHVVAPLSSKVIPPNRKLRLTSQNHPKSQVEILADQVSVNAATLTAFLQSENLPTPSFERDAPIVVLPASAPAHVKAARQALIEAAFKTFQLAVGPSEYIINLNIAIQEAASLHWLTHFGIFAMVPVEGSISYQALAAKANVSVKQLKTVARMAMTSNVFYEPEAGEIAHTATSAMLATHPNFHDWAVFMCESSIPSASRLVEACERWPGSVKKNETAHNIAFDTDLPFFDYLATQPEKEKQFARYMKNVTSGEGTAIRHLVNGFDWASLGQATVVDVGGSTGNAAITLAHEFPELSFIVEDLPANAEMGEATLCETEPTLVERVKFLAHDFFQRQPVNGAQVYLLRAILHDWPYEEATTILRNLAVAMTPGVSRILIMDTVLPPPGSLPATQERLLRLRDMAMLQGFNALERDMDDWMALLRKADKRLSLMNVVQPAGSVMSVLEVALDN
ncbi:hypothetical protein ASPZODRAFT_57439 [Penicilliopsis zonata CBS 506.65]|uniref:O-methyltransferase C-terminal domain-containing protein n=1 Tax=Penicilliopsis zonata CBS 506.65 TaxID=1073090 RepID=A0A1L9SVC7_9EURO|nr:hypothetical protein ASPZODRAFT_57439 [Penicilliopsis zonata CBS 506.65]OJJ51096.1 hypothetical protein ASPZODRAFT_57439 [Penicilliopsis zonata CBS 506.65]